MIITKDKTWEVENSFRNWLEIYPWKWKYQDRFKDYSIENCSFRQQMSLTVFNIKYFVMLVQFHVSSSDKKSNFKSIAKWIFHFPCFVFRYYHPSLPLYLPADVISKTRIKVRVSWAGLINSEQELSPNSPTI
jgi:hypothetical protein